MAKTKDPRKLATAEQEKASECIRRYAPHEVNRRSLIAKCLNMSRQRKLTSSGSYKKS